MHNKSASLALLLVAGLVFSAGSLAGEVEIVKVELEWRTGSWLVRTTLRHDDHGWDHYADAWRVVTPKGDILGTRTLYHPHDNEQPFTRALNDLMIPVGTQVVYVEAHAKKHGWSKQRVRVDLRKAKGERFEIRH